MSPGGSSIRGEREEAGAANPGLMEAGKEFGSRTQRENEVRGRRKQPQGPNLGLVLPPAGQIRDSPSRDRGKGRAAGALGSAGWAGTISWHN